jgi:hypothetical protein
MHDWDGVLHFLQLAGVRDCVGYLAASLVLCTFSVRSMRLLRCLGIASNLAFIAYAIIGAMTPILVLHSLLLPVNIYRLAQLSRDPQRAVTSRVVDREQVGALPQGCPNV